MAWQLAQQGGQWARAQSATGGGPAGGGQSGLEGGSEVGLKTGVDGCQYTQPSCDPPDPLRPGAVRDEQEETSLGYPSHEDWGSEPPREA